MDFPKFIKRNFKQETTIYGAPIQNYTSRGMVIKVAIKDVDEVTLNKILDIFYKEPTIRIKNNENGKLYYNLNFSDKELSPTESFNYDTNSYVYSLSFSLQTSK